MSYTTPGRHFFKQSALTVVQLTCNLLPLQDIHPSTFEIFLPMMLKREVAFCGFNKKYSNPAPSPRYPSQRLVPFKLLLMKNQRIL